MAPGKQDLKKLIVETFEKFDENNDGLISRTELTQVFKALTRGKFSETDVDHLMTAVDTNKDGLIQYKEFVTWVMQDSQQTHPHPHHNEDDDVHDVRKFGTVDETCPVEQRGSMTVDYRIFLPTRFEVDIAQRYALDKLTLGEGGYGKVFVAKDKECQDRRVAVKKVTKTKSDKACENLYNEIKVMKELDHPNICKLLGTFEQGRDMYFIMELCDGGELFDRIIENGFINEELCGNIVHQVSSALAYAHGRGIAHRDIKPENVVFCTKDPKDTTVKLIDWGLAMSFVGTTMNSAVGSFTYAAPEVILSANVKEYTESCDLWSLGVLTYVMLCGRPPFWGSQAQFIKNARAEKYPMSGKPWDTMNPDAKDFVKSLLKADPSKRLPIDKVMKSPWFSSYKEKFNDVAEEEHILKNLMHFSHSSQFGKMCITAVARQLDHTHLKGIHSVFRELDANGDGVLTLEEVANGFKHIFGSDSKEYKQVAELFEHMDLDGSDQIDYTEFCAAGLGQKESTQDNVTWAAFKAFDADNSGFIEIADVQKILDIADMKDAWSDEVCGQAAKDIMSKYDKDNDGKISFEDWKSLMKQCWDNATANEMAEGETLADKSAYDLLVEVSKLKRH